MGHTPEGTVMTGFVNGADTGLASLECQSPAGVLYRAAQFDRKPLGPCGEAYLVRVFSSDDQGTSWEEIPLRLTWHARIFGLFADWPPQTLDRLYCEGETLIMEHSDEWIPYERPVLPFKLDVESEWRSRYDSQGGRWTIRRLRHLDYDGGGDNPVPTRGKMGAGGNS